MKPTSPTQRMADRALRQSGTSLAEWLHKAAADGLSHEAAARQLERDTDQLVCISHVTLGRWLAATREAEVV